MCNGETSTSNKYVMAKHQLKDNKVSWQRWRNINKPGLKTNPRGAQTNKIDLYLLP